MQWPRPRLSHFNGICLLLMIAALITSLGTLHAQQSAQGDVMPKPEVTVSFSPQGEASDVQQLVLRFSVDMVRLGSGSDAPAPATLTCAPAQGPLKGRWIDSARYAWEAAEALPAGVRCEVTLHKSLKSLDGKAVQGAGPWKLSTGGPKLLEQWPYQGAQVAETQLFFLRANAPLERHSLTQHLRCELKDKGSRVIQLLDDANVITELRKNRRDLSPAQIRQQHWIGLRCGDEPLPNDAQLRLVWGKGIATPSGVSSSADQIIGYTVRPAFTARLICATLGEGKAEQKTEQSCDPRNGLTVEFSHAVTPSALKALSLQSAGKPIAFLTAEGARNEPRTQYSTGPLQERSAVTATLQGTLKDVEGRSLTNPEALQRTVTFGELPLYVGMLQSQLQLPLYPRARETAVLPIVTRRAGAQVALRQWRIGGESDAAAPLAVSLQSAWQRYVNEAYRSDEPPAGLASQAIFADAQVSRYKLPAMTQPQVATHNSLLEFAPHRLTEPGVYLIEADHPAVMKRRKGEYLSPMGATLVQVTNLHLSYKAPEQGVEGAGIVWVTALDSAQPVSNAKVTLHDCDDARIVYEGLTDAQGRALISVAQLNAARDKAACHDAQNMRPSINTGIGTGSVANNIISNPLYGYGSIVTLVVRKERDMALLTIPSTMPRVMSDALPTQQLALGTMGHAVLDRVLFKAGETVNMQHILRRGTADGFAIPSELLKRKAFVRLMFSGGEKLIDLPLSFDANGAAQSSWTIPANAKLGHYVGQVMLGDEATGLTMTHGFEFQIEEYRAPAFDARLSGAQVWRQGKPELRLDMGLSFLAGGAAAGQAVSLRGELMEGAPTPSGYARYQFVDMTAPLFATAKLSEQKLSLNAEGKATKILNATEQARLFANARPATLQAEMQFNDANGETQTIAQAYPLWPRARKLGISANVLPAARPSAQNGVELSVVMLDEKHALVANSQVKVTVQKAKWIYTNGRQKFELMGEAQPVCEQNTDAKGQLKCQWQAPEELGKVAPVSGVSPSNNGLRRSIPRPVEDSFWLLRATADAQTSAATTMLNSWQLRYTPSDAVLQLEGLDPRNLEQALDANSTAHLLVRSPYEQSTLLLTVEREGILSSSVHLLKTREHCLDMRVLGNYAPNVMVHARLIRGLHAVPEVELGGNGDTATPTGIWARPGRVAIMPPRYGGASPVAQAHAIALRVRPAAYTLKLLVTPSQATYLPRDKAPVSVSVTDTDGKPAANARVTLAVVDDALLALKPNASWALLEAMTRERYAAMSQPANDSAFMWRVRLGELADYLPPDEAARLRREIAPAAAPLSAAPSAAAGRMMAAKTAPEALAADSMSLQQSLRENAASAAPSPPPPRSNFSTLALWKADVTTDAHGNAQVNVPLPDSLTRWRVAAIATHRADQFGTAEASFTTTQPLQLLSGLALSVRSGDTLTQTLTLRNTTDKPMTVSLLARATPSFARYAASRAAPAEAVLRETGLQYSQTLALAAHENKLIAWPVVVPAGAQQLTWAISAQADGSPLKAADALEIRQVVTSAAPVTVRQSTLVQATPNANVPVAQPKGALPLQGGVSVAWQASLADAALAEVREWMRQYPYACLEQQASRLAVANDRVGWDALMMALPKYLDDKGLPRYFPTQEGANTIPGSETLALYIIDVSRFTGWSMPDEPRNRMLGALKAALEQKLPEQDWAPTHNDTARLLALQATLMEAGVIKLPIVQLNDADKLPTTSLLDWTRALLAQAPSASRTAQLNDAANLLRKRYNVQGTRLSWRNEERENWWWYMWNGNTAAARTVLVVNQWAQFDESWKKDLPLLVKGFTARQQQGHWGTTTANVWGTIALQTFAKQSEGGAVSGTSSAQLGALQLASVWVGKKDPAPVMLPLAQGAEETLKLTHQGTGSPWATVSILAAMKGDAPTSQGMTIKRSITPVQQQTKGQWRVGDVMRVKLTMSSAAELSWVVVRDPVPSGATVLGRGLARDSALSIGDQRNTGWVWPVYEERAAESYRGYYARVPRGEWSVEYTLRLNNAGNFGFPASRLEAMYAPEIFAEVPIEGLQVKP